LKPRKQTLKKLSEVFKVDYSKLLKLSGYSPNILNASAELSNKTDYFKYIIEETVKKTLNEERKREKHFPPGAMEIKASPPDSLLPLVKNVRCGELKSFITSSDEMLHVPLSWKQKGDFVVKIEGNSMKEAGILDGMLCLIKEKPVPDFGDIILVYSHDAPEECNGVLKKAKYLPDNTLIFLNGSGETLDLAENYTIVGKVIAWMTDLS